MEGLMNNAAGQAGPGLPVWVQVMLGVLGSAALIGAAMIGIRAAGEPVKQAARFTATAEARQTSVALSVTQTAKPAPTATWTPATSSIATLSTTPNPTASPTISSTPSPTYGPYFSVYTTGDAPDNHFTPTNYMGDLGDITINENWEGDSDPAHSSVIKIIYDPRGRGDDKGIHTCRMNEPTTSACKWAGVYWTHPANNWGEMPEAGYNLTGFTKLTFWARRDEQPVAAQFQVGGIGHGISTPPPYPDSIRDPVHTGWLPLTPKWTRHEIGLTGQDLRYVIGGFAWVISWANANISAGSPPLVFYLDDIRFER
jgi:hypothetical protein